MKIIRSLLFMAVFLLPFAIGHANNPPTLSKWKKGFLDIHFINTGTGNCAFAILPDGTTLLIDAGELNPTSPRVQSPRNTGRYPNYSKSGYQWKIDYIVSVFPENRRPVIDYTLITHYHDDHYGGVYPGVPKSEKGDYYLSGITGVGDSIHLKTLVDRGDSYPYDLKSKAEEFPDKSESIRNYWKFIGYQEKHNKLVHETFEVGSNQQFSLVYDPENYPDFSIRNINANGIIWSGDEKTPDKCSLPSIDEINSGESETPDENTLSCGILIQYGKFRLYTSGDIQGTQPEYMHKPDWYDMESAVAPVIGEVDVATANHHANRNAMTAYYLSILKPRVIIQEVWSSDHPGHEALLRMTSKNIWPDERDLFATNMLEANRLVIGELIGKSYKSTQGHIVLRVMPGGNQYYIYTLNHLNTSHEITGTYGPYHSK